MTDPVTLNYKLALPAFDKRGWQDAFYNNMKIIDASIATVVSIANFQGVWQNSTAYTAGMRVVDGDLATVWQCQVSHTSAASGLFGADRAAHGTYWSNYSVPSNFKGVWLANTAYAIGDWVVNGYQYAVCAVAHTSTSFASNQALNYWIVVADLTIPVAAAAASAAAAAASVGSVKVTGADTTPGVLSSKISATGLVGLSTTSPGGNEVQNHDVPIASLAEAQAGSSNVKAMTPVRVFSAILAYLQSVLTTRGDLLTINSLGNPARLAIGAANTVVVGGTDAAYSTLTALLDAAFGSTQGGILTRQAAVWALLAPSATVGASLNSAGTGANLTYGAAFPSTTALLFPQAAAPTGWTKQVTHNDKMLRVVSGTPSSGGSTAFSTIMASRTPTGTIAVNAVTLSTANLASHSHAQAATTILNAASGVQLGGACPTNNWSAGGTTATSGSGTAFTPTGSFSGVAMDFAAAYVDVMIATKD